MDRNVWLSVPEPGLAETAGTEPPPAEKLLKYFPAEALALYSALDPGVRAVVEGDSTKWALWGALVITIVFNVMFLLNFWKVQRTMQLGISCGALVLYVAALGGPFGTLTWFKPGYAVLGSVIATAFMIFVPSPPAPTP